MFLEDDRGGRFLDMMSNYGVSILGHNHPAVVEAVTRQFRALASLHGGFSSPVRAEAAAALADRCGGGLKKVFFANSGAEANEAALKFAVLATGRKRFVAFRGGFHGKTLGALSATEGTAYRAPFEPLLWDFHFAEYGETGGLEEIDGRTAGAIVEPVQGRERRPDSAAWFSGGGPPGLRQGRRRSHPRRSPGRHGPDRPVSGFVGGSTRSRHRHLGKGLAGGIPAGAVLMSDDIAAAIPRKMHTSTFGGNPPAAAGILAVLSCCPRKC
jgi:acetylornithine/succinyldiaminopimelate/putrescine aminotransferase